MTDRPIIFSGPMVRALLDGRKTMTRRVLKPDWIREDVMSLRRTVALTRHHPTLPYQPGDRLWVRERLRSEDDHADFGCGPVSSPYYVYAVDGSGVDDHTPAGASHRKSVPSIHMPRWASRLTLTVTDVRVQRLQEISEEDAIAEGMPADNRNDKAEFAGYFSPAEAFLALWNSINAARGYGWEANPWVVAISFTVECRNIDALEVAA